jgi:hypothetical protein
MMPDNTIYRVEIRNSAKGRFRVRHADLIFKHGKPFVILAWEKGHGQEEPGVVTGIDSANLTKMDTQTGFLPDYLYTGTVIGLV